MNKQLVIEHGQKITKPYSFLDANVPILNDELWYVLCVVLFISAMVVSLAMTIRNQKKQKPSPVQEAKAMIPLFLATILCIALFVSQLHSDNVYTGQVNNWKETYAYPYLMEQAYTERDLVDISGESEKWINVEYQGDDRFTKTLPSSIHPTVRYDQPPGETETVRFYQLTENLGHDMAPGEYGLSVHLTEKETE